MQSAHGILFEPMRIGMLDIKNRYVLAPISPGGLCGADGCFSERAVAFYAARAKGGAGLIVTGTVKVENDLETSVPLSLPCPTLAPLAFIRTARPLTERVHAFDARVFVQLTAGFGRANLTAGPCRGAIAPSAMPHQETDGAICRALTLEEIRTLIAKFADAAEIVQRAGFDGVEVHALHEGCLIDQFALARFNQRTDAYGGSLENRLRLACDIVRAIRQRCGKAFPVCLRYAVKSYIKDGMQGGLPGEDFIEQGRDIPEGIAAAKLLEKAGFDAFNSCAGSFDAWFWSHPPMYHDKGIYLPYAEILKKTVKAPVITAGRLDDPDAAARAILEGKTDFIGLARPLLADPELPNKVRAGQTAHIRPCLSCQEGCVGRLEAYSQVCCAVNPACGREAEYGLRAARTRKSVMIAGGGIAGMEVARVAAGRGHVVTLYERSGQLGGVAVPGGVPDFKANDHALIRWYEEELRSLQVPLIFHTEVTADIVRQARPDALVVATGARPKHVRIGDNRNVYTAEDVLNGVRDPGKSVLVVGGGLVGCEMALWLRRNGKKVTLVETAERILSLSAPLCYANRDMLEALMRFHHIDILTGSTVTDKTVGGFRVKTGAQENVILADSAILAIGYRSDRGLYDQVAREVPEIYLLGDARRVANILSAIWDAYEVARAL